MRQPFATILAICAFAGSVAGCFSNTADNGTEADASLAATDATARGGGTEASSTGTAHDGGTIAIGTDGGTPISPTAFGQNYWNWVDYGSGVTGLTGTPTLVQGLGLGVVRAGGDGNDVNSPLFDTAQIDAFVSYCRALGVEPILQVPLVANNFDGGTATAQTAAAVVTYANVTNAYGVRYWEIGNEPDLYPTQYDGGFSIQSAAEYCTAFDSYVVAMKAANALAADGGVPMEFLGPELSYKYTPSNDWLTPFLDGCKNDVDIVTIHRYPFGPTQASAQGALDDVASFRSTIQSVSAIVQAHARPGTPLGVTEANISYDFASADYTDASIIAAPGTYYAALWTADIMGAALQANLWTLAFWDLGEQPSQNDLLGFIVGGQPVPAFYAEQLLSANFRGNVLDVTGVPAGFSVYASIDPTLGSHASVQVLVINKTNTDTQLTLAIDTLVPQAVDCPPLSITLVQVPLAPGETTHITRYTADQADAGTGPMSIQ